MKRPNKSDKPTTRLTRMCEAMTAALEAHPEYGDDVKCAVMLDDPKMGGIVLYGYDDATEAVADLFLHLQAMVRSTGMDIDLIGIPNDASGLDG